MATLFSYFNRVKREDCDEDRSEDRGGGGGVDDKDSRSKRQASKSDAVGEVRVKVSRQLLQGFHLQSESSSLKRNVVLLLNLMIPMGNGYLVLQIEF